MDFACPVGDGSRSARPGTCGAVGLGFIMTAGLRLIRAKEGDMGSTMGFAKGLLICGFMFAFVAHLFSSTRPAAFQSGIFVLPVGWILFGCGWDLATARY